MNDYSQIHVLVIDDDPAVRGYLTEFLTEYGFSAQGCESTEAARDLMIEKFYEVCVVDLSLPGFSGEDLILLANKRFPKQRYIIHTGDSSYRLSESLKALGMGPEHVFQKPIIALPLLVGRIKDLVSLDTPATNPPEST